jgi:hypothetical protein
MIGGRLSGCSITSRYMSATYRAPSGPFASCTGRNQMSVERTNSVPGRARSATGSIPGHATVLRWIRLLPTSATSRSPR